MHAEGILTKQVSGVKIHSTESPATRADKHEPKCTLLSNGLQAGVQEEKEVMAPRYGNQEIKEN